MTADSMSISTPEQGSSAGPSTPDAPYNEFSVATDTSTDEVNRIAIQKNSELIYRVLCPQIQFSPRIDYPVVDVQGPNTVKNTQNPEYLDYEQCRNATNSEEENYAGENRASTSQSPSIISPQDESSGDIGILPTPPHLRLDSDDGGESANRKKIEAFNAELTVSDTLFLGRKFGTRMLTGPRKSERTPHDVGEFDPSSEAIARAPIRGRGLPNIPAKPHVSFARMTPSEVTDITDLGNHMHDLKTQGQILSSELPISLGDPKEPLQNRLIDSLLHTPGYREKKGFFPRDLLASLVDEECVAEELRLCFKNLVEDNEIRGYAQKVCGVIPTTNGQGKAMLFKKIFVTLVLSEKTSTIIDFLAEEVTDDDLPLAKVRRPGRSPGIFDLARRGKSTVPLKCFEGWSLARIHSFEEWQWTTISPFFARLPGRKNVKHFPLQDQVILPFISDSRRDDDTYEGQEFEGGFSQVFKVDIHPAHHDFHNPRIANRSFAIKCLLSRDRADFNREVDMLKKFSGDSHPHLVSLLATYEQFKLFYLIFHWAEADLVDYWKERNPNPSVDYKTILWMAQQCKGIANGLCKIHHYESSSSKVHPTLDQNSHGLTGQNLAPPSSHAPASEMEQLYGRHGDIKPANVLLFLESGEDDTMGTLKLTDFGLAEFNTVHSRSYKPKSKVAVSPSYRPPECDLQGGVIGRSYDIWTLGCLYLEFITWLLGGWNLVQDFTRRRTSLDKMWLDMKTDTFFEIVKCSVTGTPGAVIKMAVTTFISELHAHKSCTEYLHEFLDLIQHEMMIIKSNNPDVRDRLSCEEVDRKLLRMFRRCKEDVDYASKPAPWPKSPRECDPTLQTAIEADLPKPDVEALLRKDLRVHDGPTQRKFVPAPPTVQISHDVLPMAVEGV